MATSQLSDIYRFQSVTANLGTAGQPTAEQFDAVKDAGYEVVINLALGTTPRDLPTSPGSWRLTGSIMRTFPWCLTHRPTTISPSFRGDGGQPAQEMFCPLHCERARVGICDAVSRAAAGCRWKKPTPPCATSGSPIRRGRPLLRSTWLKALNTYEIYGGEEDTHRPNPAMTSGLFRAFGDMTC